jgi:hypothetical protein
MEVQEWSSCLGLDVNFSLTFVVSRQGGGDALVEVQEGSSCRGFGGDPQLNLPP